MCFPSQNMVGYEVFPGLLSHSYHVSYIWSFRSQQGTADPNGWSKINHFLLLPTPMNSSYLDYLILPLNKINDQEL